MECDWSRLPEDVLFDIAMKLECVEHLVVFSAVCTSWRAVYSKVAPQWSPGMPWLILAQNKIEIYKPRKKRKRKNHSRIRNVFDVNADKNYQMQLPETFGRRCWGCKHGWICTLGLEMDFDLVNPLTNAELSLPPAETLPLMDPEDEDDDDFAKLLRRKYIERVHLFEIPPNNELIVTVLYDLDGRGHCLAFAKPGDSAWTAIGDPHSYHYVQDLASFEGKIMLLYGNGTLAVLDMDFFQHPEKKVFKAAEYVPASKNRFYSPIYLVESFGKLLLVERSIIDDEFDTEGEYPALSYETEEFNVYMFDFEARDWMAVDDLGDVALFVGNNSAMSLRASEAANCKWNCVYFTDEIPHDDLKRFVGQDMGIYDLKKRTLQSIYDGGYVLSKFCPPFWYMPKLAA